MDLGGVMKIDDRGANDLVVGNIEVDVVVCAQPGRAPIDLHDFGKVVADMEPIPDLVGLVDLQRDAGNDAAEQILGRKGQDDAAAPEVARRPRNSRSAW